MAYAVLALISVVWGLLLIGRWWSWAAALVPALWIAQISDGRRSAPWFLGCVFGVVSAVCIAGGVAGRRSRHD